jgi:hypothetical protein
MRRRIQTIQDAVEFGEDRIGGLGSDERFGMSIVLGQIGVYGAPNVDDRTEAAASNALAGQFGEEVLNRIEPEAKVAAKWKLQRR